MKYFILFIALMSVSGVSGFEEERLNKEQIKMIKQEMEEAPSSTTIGGSKSGELEIEQRRDDVKRDHEVQKQKQLYESDYQYRRGL